MSSGTKSVEVFVTSSRKFRARIADSHPFYEVTIGGKEWQGGKGREHKQSIMAQIDNIMSKLNKQYEAIQSNAF